MRRRARSSSFRPSGVTCSHVTRPSSGSGVLATRPCSTIEAIVLVIVGFWTCSWAASWPAVIGPWASIEYSAAWTVGVIPGADSRRIRRAKRHPATRRRAASSAGATSVVPRMAPMIVRKAN